MCVRSVLGVIESLRVVCACVMSTCVKQRHSGSSRTLAAQPTMYSCHGRDCRNMASLTHSQLTTYSRHVAGCSNTASFLQPRLRLPPWLRRSACLPSLHALERCLGNRGVASVLGYFRLSLPSPAPLLPSPFCHSHRPALATTRKRLCIATSSRHRHLVSVTPVPPRRPQHFTSDFAPPPALPSHFRSASANARGRQVAIIVRAPCRRRSSVAVPLPSEGLSRGGPRFGSVLRGEHERQF